MPAARVTERWLNRRAAKARERREHMIEAVARRVAENQAQAERRANPLWRRTAAKGLETAATVGIAALVRRAFDESTSRRGPGEALSTPEKQLRGAGMTAQDTAGAASARTADRDAGSVS